MGRISTILEIVSFFFNQRSKKFNLINSLKKKSLTNMNLKSVVKTLKYKNCSCVDFV